MDVREKERKKAIRATLVAFSSIVRKHRENTLNFEFFLVYILRSLSCVID